MNAPRLEVDLGKIHHNARTLVERLAERGITVTGVTKALCGSPAIAEVLLSAGVSGLGDSRIENIEIMRRGHVAAPLHLIRSPMLSQVGRVVAQADRSLNSELSIIEALSEAAGKAKRVHEVVLMVELGDLREGIMPADLNAMAAAVLCLPHVRLSGIGANLACHGGVGPDATNMGLLSSLADSIETAFGVHLAVVSGGNSANLHWALSGADTGRINNLRLGESILLGCNPLNREPIEGLWPDAITLVAEVIEARVKPTRPWGTVGQTAFGTVAMPATEGHLHRTILAIGHQDVDPSGLDAPRGMAVLGASGDHLIIHSDGVPPVVGEEIRFGVNYSALVRAATSPFVSKVMTAGPARLDRLPLTDKARPAFHPARLP